MLKLDRRMQQHNEEMSESSDCEIKLVSNLSASAESDEILLQTVLNVTQEAEE